MIIRFWGVRGSLPTPLTPQQVQSKIMAVIQRISAEDLVSADTRAKFAAKLPEWIFGTTGGNTPCVEISAGASKILLDAGTGIRVFGKSQYVPSDHHYHLFFSHFHWDHIQGLPFFDDAYNPASIFDVYSCHEDPEKYLREQMIQPYYPVPFEAFTKNFKFHKLTEESELKLKDNCGSEIIVNACEMNHPGKSFTYSFEHNGKKVVYATDVELKAINYDNNPAVDKVFKNADCIVIDSQYTVQESYRKENWGHSAFCYAVDFAIHWNIKKLYLFHHEPTYDDKKLNSILQAARWYAMYTEHSDVQIELAKEGVEIEL